MCRVYYWTRTDMTSKEEFIQRELIAITSQLLLDSGITYRRDIKLDAQLQQQLGIDSLVRAELFQRIEKQFSVTMPDQLLAEAETLNDIAHFLMHADVKELPRTHERSVVTHSEKSNVDPSHAATLIDVLQLYAKHHSEKAHVYFQHENGEEEIITYGQLLNRSLRIADGLVKAGLKEGDTVAIMQPTTPWFFYTFLGTLLAGGVPIPIYPPFRAHMLEAYAKTESRILKNAEVRVLVTFDKAEKLSYLLQAFVPSLKVVTTPEQLISSDELANPFNANGHHPAFIQYTSGSTNDPKGVLLSHFNLLTNIRTFGKRIEVNKDDVAVSWLPLYHDFGLIGAWLGSFYHGVPLILMTPFSFLNHPERWLWAIHRHRGTISAAPNFAYELCVRKMDHAQLEGLDLSSWRIAANGAEKVYPKTLESFAEKFARYGFKRNAILPVYGLAESTVGLTVPPVEKGFQVDYIDRKQFEEDRLAVPSTSDQALAFVNCGIPIDDHAIRVVDDEGNALPYRHIGSLQFQGPSSMQGYYNNPLATSAIYHDGWWDTGDLAYITEDGLYITGRRKDLIIKAGRNLYPVEIEELVGLVNGVRQGCVAAFGVTDAKRGTEQLIVVAETNIKEKKSREDLMEHINAAISSVLDMVPDQVVLVEPRTVPKTSSGKLQRSACKQAYLKGELTKTKIPVWMQMTKLGMAGLFNRGMSLIKLLGRWAYNVYLVVMLLVTFIPVYIFILFSSTISARKALRRWAGLILRLALCPVEIKGGENLTKNSPLIFTSNHASYIDTVVLLSFLPLNTRFVGKKELLATPLLSTLMRRLDYLSADRADWMQGVENTKQMEASLKEGHSILIFPEGTFGYAVGLRPFRMGAFKVSANADVSICPIALDGTRFILRSESFLLRPGRIKVTVSAPIQPMGEEWSQVVALRDAVRKEIAAHCGEPSLDYIAAQTVASSLHGE
jgi:fatty-acyl-CoA synthase